MIDAVVFYARRDICEKCPHWKGVCLKGHALASPVGCPEKRFEPVEGASYMEDRPAAVIGAVAQPGPCCQGTAVVEDVRELTYAEAAKELAGSMKEWAAAGFPLRTEAEYLTCVDICKSNQCGFYRWYQCRICKCVIFAKAKLRTTDCPRHLWPKL